MQPFFGLELRTVDLFLNGIPETIDIVLVLHLITSILSLVSL